MCTENEKEISLTNRLLFERIPPIRRLMYANQRKLRGQSRTIRSKHIVQGFEIKKTVELYLVRLILLVCIMASSWRLNRLFSLQGKKKRKKVCWTLLQVTLLKVFSPIFPTCAFQGLKTTSNQPEGKRATHEKQRDEEREREKKRKIERQEETRRKSGHYTQREYATGQ